MKPQKSMLLVVEDESDMQENYQDLLSGDYNLVIVGNGHDAVSEYQKNLHQLKAIILDINLPDMTGYEVVRQFEAVSFTDMPPIIVVTAYTESMDVIRSLESQAYHHLSKPFSSTELSKILNDAIQDPLFTRRSCELARDM
ncbi:response regulator, partial [bacterium]|nr:response regulator [bacterium]